MKRVISLSLAMLSCLPFVSITARDRALKGGIIGGALGGLIGGAAGGGKGAGIGLGIGAVTGAVAGAASESQHRGRHHEVVYVTEEEPTEVIYVKSPSKKRKKADTVKVTAPSKTTEAPIKRRTATSNDYTKQLEDENALLKERNKALEEQIIQQDTKHTNTQQSIK